MTNFRININEVKLQNKLLDFDVLHKSNLPGRLSETTYQMVFGIDKRASRQVLYALFDAEKFKFVCDGQ